MHRLYKSAVVSLICFVACRQPSFDWASVKEWVRAEFPNVEHISAEELRRRLESSDVETVLLDVREEEEYRVSHLPGAVRVDPAETEPDFVAELDRETPIVAYCSVGYRSSRLVEALKRQGFTDVKNLEGSIFEWANEGHPVERDGREVEEVHPYDEEWGRLLDPALRAYEPGSK